LWPPTNNPTATPDWPALSAACDVLQDEMLRWGTQGFGTFDSAEMFDDTLACLIAIYLKDPDSPYRALRYQSSVTYAKRLEYLRRDAGALRISTVTFRDFKRLYWKWRTPEKDGDPENISRAVEGIKFIRIALSFGVLLKLSGCVAAKGVLSEMEFENPKRRNSIVTQEQANLIRKEAHRVGLGSIALAQAMQGDLIVRQKDVIGERIPLSYPGTSDIVIGNRKWVGGFRFEKLDQNMILEHRLSKSLRGKRALASPDAGTVKRWNLLLYPNIMEELCLMAGVPLGQLRREMLPASGPMIRCDYTGLPWSSKVFANKWRELARAVGIPDEVQNRDTRAGGATDADQKGADVDRKRAAERIRPALGHAKAETTLIYLRDEDEATARIAELRFGKKAKDSA
jgi:hypothetical protein